MKIKEIKYKSDDMSLHFCPIVEAHAEPIHNAVMESIDNLLPFNGWAHGEMTIENQVERIKKSVKEREKGKIYTFTVFDCKSNELLMSASLTPPKCINRNAFHIGYWTALKHCNKGYATQATKVLVVLAFEYLNVDRVEISCLKSNRKSARVIEKCGFEFEGEIRNYENEPTPSMIKNGHIKDRTGLLFGLIREDIPKIPWYIEVKENIHIST